MRFNIEETNREEIDLNIALIDYRGVYSSWYM